MAEFSPLYIQNSLTRKKELFTPLNAPYVGMYVCGPTVYSNVHLGNVRTFLTFDVVYRYLSFLGYQVRVQGPRDERSWRAALEGTILPRLDASRCERLAFVEWD